MKKILFVSMMLFGAMSANAQFTVYQPVEVPHTSHTPSSGYGTPFTIYEHEYGNPNQQQQQARPKMQEVTLRGYYKNGNTSSESDTFTIYSIKNGEDDINGKTDGEMNNNGTYYFEHKDYLLI